MSENLFPQKPHPQYEDLANRLIGRLQDQLLALSEMEGAISPQDIERSAKAISQLVKGLQDAEAFVNARGEDERYGYRPKAETRAQFLIRLQRLVDLGILKELSEGPDHA